LYQSFLASYLTVPCVPYFQKEASLREAPARGDGAALRAGITAVIKMVRTANIDEDAAVELVNYLYVWRATLKPHVKYAGSK